MRNITKIFLLIVVAFVAYLLWPRTPSLKAFTPSAMASLQIQNWQAQKSGKGMNALIARFKIYSSQYGFSPITAMRLAQAQASALSQIASLKGTDPDPDVENRALASLTEKYTMMKQALHASFDASTLAREEFGWRLSEQDPQTNPDVIVSSMCRILAAMYDGTPEEFTDAATSVARARAIILTGNGSASEAMTAAKEGYSLLREIAMTPVSENPAP